MYININDKNEITEVFDPNHPGITINSIYISDDNYNVIKKYGYDTCVFIGGKVLYSDNRKIKNTLEYRKNCLVSQARIHALQLIIQDRIQLLVNKIKSIDNIDELESIDIIKEIEKNKV